MKIVIQPQGTLAIYEQIVNQLKSAVVTGELKAGEALPSIRALAGDLGVSVITTKRAYEELDLRTIEYANSILERKEVYRDQVKSTGKILDDAFIDHLWELTLEDNFLGLLTLDDNQEELTVIKQSKGQLKDAGFSKQNSIKTKDIVDFLVAIPELESVAMRLYHYFKYFSQYEHFSENGQGDVLASMEKDGNDNIHLPSAIRALSVGVEEVIKN